MKQCDYCEQDGIETDCLGKVCCINCWEMMMKDWTLEDEDNLQKLAKETCNKLHVTIPEIKKENGLDPGSRVMVCIACRKLVQSSEDGFLFCECTDERDSPYVVPIH